MRGASLKSRAEVYPGVLLWGIALLMLAVSTLWAWWWGVTITDRRGYHLTMLNLLLFSLVFEFYAKDSFQRVRLFVMTFLFFMIFGFSARLLNYFTTALPIPPKDSMLVAADSLLGFDWIGMTETVNAHPVLGTILAKAYGSHKILFLILIVYFIFARNTERLREFTEIFVITVLLTLMISTFVPAGGAYLGLQPPAEAISNLPKKAGRYALDHFLALKQGGMQVLDLGKLVGLATFPSYHTVMGLMVIHASRGTILFLPLSLAAAVMIAATPTFGGHYLVDVIAGACVFFLALFVQKRMRAWQRRCETWLIGWAASRAGAIAR